MKPVMYKMMLAFIVVGGLFIGMLKGQQARTKWMNKMKSRYDNKPIKSVANPDEIVLDDYEWQSFHNS